MATEQLQAAPYPVASDAPDGPAQILALAQWARTRVVQVYASVAARTAAFSAAGISPTEGMLSWLQDKNRFEEHNGTVWVPLGNARCGGRWRRAAAQSVATGGSTTAITWDTEDEDTDGMWSSGTTITIPSGLGGLWLITFQCVAGVTGRSYMQITPTSAVTGVPAEFRAPIDPAEDRGFVTALVPLNAGDSFTCGVFHSTGAGVNFTAWVSAFRYGD